MTPSIALSGDLGVCGISAQRAALLAALEQAPAAALDLDLAEVSEFDGAGLQLLLCAARHAQSRGGRVRIVAAAPRVQSVLGLLGLDESLRPVASSTREERP